MPSRVNSMSPSTSASAARLRWHSASWPSARLSVPDSRLYVFKLGGKAAMPELKRHVRVAPEPPVLAASEADTQAGAMLYAENCAVCHGLGGFSGHALPDLRYLTPEKHAVRSHGLRFPFPPWHAALRRSP